MGKDILGIDNPLRLLTAVFMNRKFFASMGERAQK